MKYFLMVAALLFLVGCGSTTQSNTVAQEAQRSAQSNNVYVPKNRVEQSNYNQRQRIADSASTILWCTSAFSTTGAPMFTVPIVGKLTSGGKRPIPTEQSKTGYAVDYTTELPGPDGMYGSSGEYRYGFSPSGNYYEFYGIETFCTTEPTIFQKEKTTIVSGTDPTLFKAQQEAQKILVDGCGEDAGAPKASSPECTTAEKKAQEVLNNAIVGVGGK